MSNKTVVTRSFVEDHRKALEPSYGILASVLASRGVSAPEDGDLSLSGMLSPASLLNINEASEKIADVIESKGKIIIAGDYDCDGATSTAIVIRALNLMGHDNVDYHIPDRFIHGYGLSVSLVNEIADLSPDLIITVDSGISSLEGAARAKDLGIDLVITDHHLEGSEKPADCIIVNPNQKGDKFASKNIAGCGVAFYVMCSVKSKLISRTGSKLIKNVDLRPLLDLVAFGTIADVVVLDKNNRIMINAGIKRIRRGHGSEGIKALIDISGAEQRNVLSTTVGFTLGPRLNAAGRLESMRQGVRLLISDDSGECEGIAYKLNDLNTKRKEIEASMRGEADAILDGIDLTSKISSVCVHGKDWHQGVIGILASRLKDKYYRPTVVFASDADGKHLKGSCRSVEGIHIRDALDAVSGRAPGLIVAFGGHAMAAGLTIKGSGLDEFKKLFEEEVSAQATGDELSEKILVDANLDINDITIELAELIEESGPWGQGFPEPTFKGEFRVVSVRGNPGIYVAAALTSVGCEGPEVNTIQFGGKGEDIVIGDILNVVFTIAINHFRGLKSVQLMIQHYTK